MNLIDLYTLLDKIQRIVGNKCRVYVCAHDGLLEIQFGWFVNDKLIHYRKCVSLTEMESVYDIDAYLDVICIAASRQYEMKVKGEE